MSAVAKDLKQGVVACLSLLQSIHVSQYEHINAFGTDSWRKDVRSCFAKPACDSSTETLVQEPKGPRCSLTDRCCNLFRTNTCKSVSRQMTLTPYRINTCEKPWGVVPVRSRRRPLHPPRNLCATQRLCVVFVRPHAPPFPLQRPPTRAGAFFTPRLSIDSK